MGRLAQATHELEEAGAGLVLVGEGLRRSHTQVGGRLRMSWANPEMAEVNHGRGPAQAICESGEILGSWRRLHTNQKN